MPKSLIVELAVPSGSRPSSMLSWLNKLLNPHRMSALTVSEVLPEHESYAVLRGPSTMEDEGRSFLHGVYRTAEEALAAKQEADGYYTFNIYKRIN